MDKKIEELYRLTKLANKRFIIVINRELDDIQKALSKLNRNMNLKIAEGFFDVLLLKSNNVTIKTIEKLIDNERLDDAIVLKRALLERIAIVFKGLNDNLGLEDIERLQGYKCIKNLKIHFDIGRMYGFFSSIADSNPSKYLNFALINSFKRNKDGKNREMDKIKLLFSISLCFLVEMNLAVTEFLAKRYLKKENGWRLSGSNDWHYTSKSNTSWGGSLPHSLNKMYHLFVENNNKVGHKVKKLSS